MGKIEGELAQRVVAPAPKLEKPSSIMMESTNSCKLYPDLHKHHEALASMYIHN